MRLEYTLQGNKASLILKKDDKQIKLQYQVKTEKGILFVSRIIRDTHEELANPSKEGENNNLVTNYPGHILKNWGNPMDCKNSLAPINGMFWPVRKKSHCTIL